MGDEHGGHEVTTEYTLLDRFPVAADYARLRAAGIEMPVKAANAPKPAKSGKVNQGGSEPSPAGARARVMAAAGADADAIEAATGLSRRQVLKIVKAAQEAAAAAEAAALLAQYEADEAFERAAIGPAGDDAGWTRAGWTRRGIGSADRDGLAVGMGEPDQAQAVRLLEPGKRARRGRGA